MKMLSHHDGDFSIRLECFERAWQSGSPPNIADFLVDDPINDAANRAALIEFVVVDLEYRWKFAADSQPDSHPTEASPRGSIPSRPLLEDYANRYPGLGDVVDLPLELVCEEYRVRRRWSNEPLHDQYQLRFPMYAEQLHAALSGIDKEVEAATAAAIGDVGIGRNDVARPAPAETIHMPSDSDGSGGLHVRCPHCHNPIELVPDAPLEEIECPSCGSNFSLAGNDQNTRQAETITQLGQFQLVERLGMGAFGTVWKARDTRLDRTVALKVPRKGQLGKEETEKFFREARTAAQVRHPNIVPVHEVGRDGDSLYIVSDFIRGVPLSEMLADARMTFREAAKMAATIAEALHHAHEAGVVHRDLKPQNIMVDGKGQPHLMDFGLAKRDAGEVTMTLDGAVLGTPAYMSPEQAIGKSHDVDRRSDVYSLGVMLFQMLTGELPFRGSTRMLIHKVINEDAPSPRRLDNQVPRDLETICLKCLQKDPKHRYPTADEVGKELNRYLRGEPIEARPQGSMAKSWRWCKRNSRVAILCGVIGLTLSVGMGVSAYFAVLANHREWETRMEIISNSVLARNLMPRLRYETTRNGDWELLAFCASHFESTVLALRTRVQSNPDDFLATSYLSSSLDTLGVIRLEQGASSDAEMVFRESLTYQNSKLPYSWYSQTEFLLGCSLIGQGRFEEADAYLRRGFDALRNDDRCDDEYLARQAQRAAQICARVGETNRLRKWRETLDEYDSRLPVWFPDRMKYYASLGYVHQFNGEWDEGIAAYQQALNIEHDYTLAYGPLRQARRLASLDAELDSVMRGEQIPETGDDWIEYAKLCAYKQLYRQSVNCYVNAFSADAYQAVQDPDLQYRYHAACMAVLAAIGEGSDAPETMRECAELRRTALGWLQDDLTVMIGQQSVGTIFGFKLPQESVEMEARNNRSRIVQVLHSWKLNKDLSSVREPSELAKLPAEERVGYEELWLTVNSLLASDARAEK